MCCAHNLSEEIILQKALLPWSVNVICVNGIYLKDSLKSFQTWNEPESVMFDTRLSLSCGMYFQ